MGTINYLQAIKPDTAHIRKIIENSLLCDWAIKIEYLDMESEIATWQTWDKTWFAVNSARPVLESLANCYKANPRFIIRIHAEKFRPQSTLLFCVYNPSHLLAEKDNLHSDAPDGRRPRQHVESTDRTGLIT